MLHCPCCHNARNTASKSENHWDEGLSMQSNKLVHYPVHYKSRSGQISAVFKEAYDEEQNGDLRNENKHSSNSADYAVN